MNTALTKPLLCEVDAAELLSKLDEIERTGARVTKRERFNDGRSYRLWLSYSERLERHDPRRRRKL